MNYSRYTIVIVENELQADLVWPNNPGWDKMYRNFTQNSWSHICVYSDHHGGWCSKQWFEERNGKILTFSQWAKENNVELFEQVNVGDEVLGEDGDKRVVLAKIDNVIAVSHYTDDTKYQFDAWVSREEFNNYYSVEETDTDVTEFTLKELAKLVGVDLAKLRIKD